MSVEQLPDEPGSMMKTADLVRDEPDDVDEEPIKEALMRAQRRMQSAASREERKRWLTAQKRVLAALSAVRRHNGTHDRQNRDVRGDGPDV